MSIAPTLQKYLAAENIQYKEIHHEPSMSSARTAEACHISGDRLAKGIVLRRDGEYVLAVVPASHHLRLSDLRTTLGDTVQMADESEIDQLFRDCAHGAVPAIGKCYGLDIIVDDSIETQPEIYMEAGDHETLLHLTHAQFARLTANAPHAGALAPTTEDLSVASAAGQICWGQSAFIRCWAGTRSGRSLLDAAAAALVWSGRAGTMLCSALCGAVAPDRLCG